MSSQNCEEFEDGSGPLEDDGGELISLLLRREKLDADPEKEAEKQVEDNGNKYQTSLDRNILVARSSNLEFGQALPIESSWIL